MIWSRCAQVEESEALCGSDVATVARQSVIVDALSAVRVKHGAVVMLSLIHS